MIVLEVALLALLHLAVLAGLIAVVLGLSGNFILIGLGLLVAWIGGFQYLGFDYLAMFLALAIVGEVVEALLGVASARKFGATRWGMIGTFLGGILGAAVGTAWLPIIGSLVGAFVGAFLGALAGELLRGARLGPSAKAGTGAFLGKVLASVFKFMIGGIIGFYTLKAAYPLI